MPASKPGLFKNVPHSDITYRITGVAMAVHNEHGPGHREEFYQSAMTRSVALPKPPCSLDFEEEFSLPIYNADGQLVYTYRVDFFVARVVLVEIKAHHEPLNNDELSQVFDYFAATPSTSLRTSYAPLPSSSTLVARASNGNGSSHPNTSKFAAIGAINPQIANSR